MVGTKGQITIFFVIGIVILVIFTFILNIQKEQVENFNYGGVTQNNENSKMIKVPLEAPHIRTNRFITKSVCHHAALMANNIDATAISTLTNSGYTAFQISAWRPQSHILAFTTQKRILGKLNLLWGVRAFFYDENLSTDDTVVDINRIAKEKNYVASGDIVINLTSMPVEERGMVNTLRVSEID